MKNGDAITTEFRVSSSLIFVIKKAEEMVVQRGQTKEAGKAADRERKQSRKEGQGKNKIDKPSQLTALTEKKSRKRFAKDLLALVEEVP